MSFILFINKDINHLNNAISDMLGNTLKRNKNIDFITLIFVDFLLYIQFRNH